MKNRILVLDRHTNGHEAAVVFIERQGWPEEECEVVFCGTHTLLLDLLAEGPAFAVVPIHNTIAGEVREVVGKLADLREKGYVFGEVDRLEHQVNHCLMAHPDIQNASELARIFSHEKALQQCGIFLGRIGITEEKRSERDSTGNAAKIVGLSDPKFKFGAIAPKAAAVAYGLHVLAEGIQDIATNLTTFLLLENKAEVANRIIGIIGIDGGVGQLLKAFFEGLGCTVIGADKTDPTGLTNQEVVEQAEVVIFSIPIRKTPREIRALHPYFREGQLLMDVTSVKQPAVEAMLESDAQVVGLHPMFRPDVSFEGQTVVACPARLTDPGWKNWVVNMLAATGSTIKWSSSAVHDGYMTTVQVNPQLSNLVNALLITESGVSVKESLGFTSPFYRVMFAQMGRLIGQNPKLYAAIAIENPETLLALRRRIEIEERLADIIERKDYEAFVALFAKAREHFGEDAVKEANELFVRLLGVLTTLYGPNSVILEFTGAHNRPGLLARICEVFEKHGINMAAINSVVLDGEHRQFVISLEQPTSFETVRTALDVIEGWKEPRVKVILG